MSSDSPLVMAARAGDVEAAERLLAAGEVVDPPALHAAAERGPLALVDLLIRHGAVEWMPDRSGRSPLQADIGWLHRLPARDMPQDVLDEALVHAAQNERPAAVEWLLDRGADPNQGPTKAAARCTSPPPSERPRAPDGWSRRAPMLIGETT